MHEVVQSAYDYPRVWAGGIKILSELESELSGNGYVSFCTTEHVNRGSGSCAMKDHMKNLGLAETQKEKTKVFPLKQNLEIKPCQSRLKGGLCFQIL